MKNIKYILLSIVLCGCWDTQASDKPVDELENVVNALTTAPGQYEEEILLPGDIRYTRDDFGNCFLVYRNGWASNYNKSLATVPCEKSPLANKSGK